MLTIDAQVHAYERNHPGRPWVGTLTGPAEVTGDQMVAAMDAVGVDGAILVSPFSMYRYDASYAKQVYAAHPDRFGLVKPVNPADPSVADTIADWADTAGTVGIRVFLRDNASTDPADPAINRVLSLAAQHSIPVNLACTGRLDQAGGLAARNPNTRLGIDHLGLPQPHVPPAPAEPFAAPAKPAGARGPRQYSREGQRGLHAVARTVPLPGYLGSARPRGRRVRVRPLHVGNGLDPRGQSADLRAGGRGILRHRSPVRQRESGSYG